MHQHDFSATYPIRPRLIHLCLLQPLFGTCIQQATLCHGDNPLKDLDSGLSGEGSSLERRPCLIEKADRVNWPRILHKVHAGRRQSSRGISSQQRSSPLMGIPCLHMQPPSCAVLRRGPIAQCRPRRCQPICLVNAQQTLFAQSLTCEKRRALVQRHTSTPGLSSAGTDVARVHLLIYQRLFLDSLGTTCP